MSQSTEANGYPVTCRVPYCVNFDEPVSTEEDGEFGPEYCFNGAIVGDVLDDTEYSLCRALALSPQDWSRCPLKRMHQGRLRTMLQRQVASKPLPLQTRTVLYKEP